MTLFLHVLLAEPLDDPGLPLVTKHDLSPVHHLHLNLVPGVASLEPEPVVIRVHSVLAEVPNLKVHLLDLSLSKRQYDDLYLDRMFLSASVVNVS